MSNNRKETLSRAKSRQYVFDVKNGKVVHKVIHHNPHRATAFIFGKPQNAGVVYSGKVKHFRTLRGSWKKHGKPDTLNGIHGIIKQK